MAASVLQRAVSLFESAGNDDLDLAQSKLADVFFDQGHLEEALALYRVLVDRLDAGPDPPGTKLALRLYNVGRASRSLGYLESGLKAYRRALAVAVEALGDRHPIVAHLRAGMGNLLFDLGEHAGGRAELELAVAIAEERYEPTHSLLGEYRNSLGQVMRQLGDYEAAAELYAESLKHHTEGEDAIVSRLLASLAETTHLSGDSEEALVLYNRALELKEGRFGQTHAEVASIRELIGDVLIARGDTRDAEDAYLQALSIYQQVLPDLHPDIPQCMLKIGRALLVKGDLAEAEPLISRSLELRRTVLGEDHPDVAEAMVVLATLRLRQGEPIEALRLAVAAETRSRQHLAISALELPEQVALRYAATRDTGLDVALSVVQQNPAEAEVEAAWNAVVRSRALVLRQLASRYQAARATTPTEEWLAMRAAARRYSGVVVRGAGSDTPESYQAVLKQARRDYRSAEQAFARSAPQPTVLAEDVTLSDLRSSLPENAGLLAWVRYQDLSSGDTVRSPDAYMGLLLTQDTLTALRLGPAVSIDALIDEWLSEVRTPPRLGHESDHRKPGSGLRAQIWDPFVPYLDGVTRLLVVPDGTLHLVNLGALPDDGDGYLIEGAVRFHRLTGEHQVAARTSFEPGVGLLTLGGVDFSNADGDPGSTDRPFEVATRGGFPCDLWTGRQFDLLPATESEVARIADIWRASSPGRNAGHTALAGAAATESEFRRLSPGQRYLHLATHGFFLSPTCFASPADSRGVGAFGPGRPLESTTSTSLRLSGLALAGANHRFEVPPGHEDGVLTAEEIAGLDLSSVEWAVLSACDTGLGEIQPGEGVLGLQRAFLTAGVGTVVMSLWSVDDVATVEWMNALYRARLIEGRDAFVALQAATLEVLAKRRATGATTHPFFWAAFVSIGEWQESKL